MNKKKLLKESIDQMEKQFGKESVILFCSKSHVNVETFSIGSLVLNYIIGVCDS